MAYSGKPTKIVHKDSRDKKTMSKPRKRKKSGRTKR